MARRKDNSSYRNQGTMRALQERSLLEQRGDFYFQTADKNAEVFAQY